MKRKMKGPKSPALSSGADSVTNTSCSSSRLNSSSPIPLSGDSVLSESECSHDRGERHSVSVLSDESDGSHF